MKRQICLCYSGKDEKEMSLSGCFPLVLHPVRLAYQSPASTIFLSITNQPTVVFSQTKSAPTISHQPNEQAAGVERKE
jgi:hypothetical protein